MRENPKEFTNSFSTFWLLKAIPTKGTNRNTVSDKPIPFRGKLINTKFNKTALILNFIANGSSSIIETRADLPFKPQDKILNSLTRNDLGEFTNIGKVNNVGQIYDADLTMRNLRTKANDVIHIIGVES